MKFKDLVPWKTDSKELAKDDPFTAFRNHISELFRDFEKGTWPHFEMAWPKDFAPAQMKMDIAETDEGFGLTVELPGMDAKEVEIKLEGNALVIRGEKRNETKEDKDSTWHRREITYGSFYRALQLPEEADVNKIAAKFDKGILKIDIPKTRAAMENKRTIPISS